MRRRCAAVVACVLLASGCGVDLQEEPQLIEVSTQQSPPAPPSFDADSSPATTSSVPASLPRTPTSAPAPTG